MIPDNKIKEIIYLKLVSTSEMVMFKVETGTYYLCFLSMLCPFMLVFHFPFCLKINYITSFMLHNFIQVG